MQDDLDLNLPISAIKAWISRIMDSFFSEDSFGTKSNAVMALLKAFRASTNTKIEKIRKLIVKCWQKKKIFAGKRLPRI